MNDVRGVERRRLRSVWSGMIARCTDPANKRFHRYGGRGITVCERWASFENFIADMAPRPEGHQLERINNDGGYSPENCRWATPTEQARNKSNNRLLTFAGETLCITEWAERMGVTRELLRDRLQSGWSVERALTAPLDPVPAPFCPNGHERTPENLYTPPSGKTTCRACIRLASARYKAKKMGLPFPGAKP